MTTTTNHRAPLFLLNAQYLPSSVDWRRSKGQHSPFDPTTFISEAQCAETAGFDAFFQADFSGVNRAGLRAGPPLTAFEPFQLAALAATATTRIAVMPTVSTLHTHPFTFARNLASLDRISGGRAWINIVSSYRPGTALGAQRQTPRERRHDQTEEFIDVARRLWSSWPTEANTPDINGDRYIRDDLVIDLDHRGEFYDQPGPIDMPPLSARFPFTLQATSSLPGLRLAARTADGVFVGTPTLGAAQQLRRILHAETARAGRAPGSVALLPGCYIHVTGSDEQARLAFAERQRVASAFAGATALTQLRARFPALELAGTSPQDRLPANLLPDDPDEVFARHGSHYLPLWDLARGHTSTVGEFASDALRLNEHAKFVGTADQITDEIIRWIDHGGVDGFQLILGNDFDTVCDHIIPAVIAATRPSATRASQTRIAHTTTP